MHKEPSAGNELCGVLLSKLQAYIFEYKYIVVKAVKSKTRATTKLSHDNGSITLLKYFNLKPSGDYPLLLLFVVLIWFWFLLICFKQNPFPLNDFPIFQAFS